LLRARHAPDFRRRAEAFVEWVVSAYAQEIALQRDLQLGFGAASATVAGEAQAATEPVRLLLVSHGGFIHTLMGLLVDVAGKPMVNNCSITRIALSLQSGSSGEATADADGGGLVVGGRRCTWRLLEANVTAHLGDQQSASTW
jgi:broad specificity phosphatase PhoE